MRLQIILTLIFIGESSSYKILVFNPQFSQSISNFLGNIADTLVDAGHNVTTLIPIINAHYKAATSKSRIIRIPQTDEVKKLAASVDIEGADFFDYNDFHVWNSIPFGRSFMRWVNAQCKGVLDEPGLLDKLNRERFDVMIVENFESCGVAISHLIKPKALITAAGSIPMGSQPSDFGLDKSLSYNPNPFISDIDVHSIWSRAKNILADVIFYLTYSGSRRTEIDTMFSERFGPDFPSVYEISSHAAYSLINSDPLFDFATPTLSRIVYIGGMGAKEPKPLDWELETILSTRNKAVLISLGSIVTSCSLPIKAKQNILKMVQRFPEVTFVWKYEKTDDDFAKTVASVPNLYLSKWLPQNDLLADPRIVAFITHGGMASTQETALRGKPGLFIPFFADQPRNSAMMERNGLGKVFQKQDMLDAEKLYKAVKDLIENQSYYDNASLMAKKIKKRPFSAKEMLVRTVEFAAEFGPSPALRPVSFDMSWCAYNNFDVIGLLSLVIVIGIYAVTKTMRLAIDKISQIVKIKIE